MNIDNEVQNVIKVWASLTTYTHIIILMELAMILIGQYYVDVQLSL